MFNKFRGGDFGVSGVWDPLKKGTSFSVILPSAMPISDPYVVLSQAPVEREWEVKTTTFMAFID